MWEYQVRYLFDSELNKTLSEMGAEGWELVSVVISGTYNCFFKRRKVDFTNAEVVESGDYPK